MATTVQQLLAGAAGGPAAVTESAVKGNAQAAANTAISQLAANAGKMDAPGAFAAAQTPQLQMPANAAASAANTVGSGAATANGQVSGAVNAYRAAVDAAKPLVAKVMQASMMNPYSGTLATSMQDMAKQSYEQNRYANAAQTSATTDSVQKALNSAAATGMNPQAYNVLKTTLNASKSAPEAQEILNQHVQLATNSDGSPVLDSNGQPIYQVTDPATGQPIKDADGNPVPISSTELDNIQSQILPAYGMNNQAIQGAISGSAGTVDAADAGGNFIGAGTLPTMNALYPLPGEGQ